MRYIIFIISLVSFINAQQKSDVFQSWNSIKLDYKLSKNFQINYEVQLRLKSNRDLYDQFINEFDFKYDFSSNLFAGFVFRYFEKNDDYGNYIESKNFTRNQFYFGLKIQKFRYELELQARYQIKNKVSSDRDYKIYIPKKYFRYKLTISKDFKNWKLDPKLNFEFFLRDKSYADIYDKIRFSFGTKYKFNNSNSINVGYFYDDDFSLPFKIEGIKIRYNYSL